jgi:hypothetical protein
MREANILSISIINIVKKDFVGVIKQQSRVVVRPYYEEIGNQRNFDFAREIVPPAFKLFPDSAPPYRPRR